MTPLQFLRQLLRILVCLPLAACGCGPAASPDVDSRRVAAEKPAAAIQPPKRTSQPEVRSAVEPGEPISATAAEEPLAHADFAKPPAPQPLAAQPVFRASQPPPKHDEAALAELGIRAYKSKHLWLYSDIEPETAAGLPAFVDAAYAAWEEYFGPLPPSRDGSVFVITGYLMRDKALFREAGLLTAEIGHFVNGRHRGAQFWMNEQEFAYYRRHLLIHEATHCFMETLAGPRFLEELPVWYWEGMAELFGTHRVLPDGSVQFGVMPHDKTEFEGLGRIKIIHDAMRAGKYRSIEACEELQPNDFLHNEAYAWSWALCQFLNSHPRYRERFRQLAGYLTGRRFQIAFHERFDRDFRDLEAEWPLFAFSLEEGFDLERAAIDFRLGKALSAGAEVSCEIHAHRGWQSSGVLLEAGQTYEVQAEGRCTLAKEPKPWISEPQGISFTYFDGRPLGQLLAAIRIEDAVEVEEKSSLLSVNPIGRGQTFAAPVSGTLYFRVNDAWSALADNDGKIRVTVSKVVR